MGNRLLLNVTLMVLGSLLLGLIWLTQEKVSDNSIPLTTLDIASIQSITIQRKNQKTVKLVKASDRWTMTSPFITKALSGKIERLLRISQIKATVKYPLLKDKLELYGFDRAPASITFDKTQLTIGKTNPIGQRRYISDGASIYLVDDTFLHYLTAAVTDYVDTRLLDSNSPIKKLETRHYTISQQADFTWIDEGSPADSLSPDSVQILLDEWRFARAIRVANVNDRTVESLIKISFENNKEREFLVSKNQHEVFLTDKKSQLSYVFSVDKFNKLAMPPSATDI